MQLKHIISDICKKKPNTYINIKISFCEFERIKQCIGSSKADPITTTTATTIKTVKKTSVTLNKLYKHREKTMLLLSGLQHYSRLVRTDQQSHVIFPLTLKYATMNNLNGHFTLNSVLMPVHLVLGYLTFGDNCMETDEDTCTFSGRNIFSAQSIVNMNTWLSISH